MATKDNISSGVAEAWAKLSNRWQGDAADVFHREYIIKMLEMTETFEKACSELDEVSAALSKELSLIEHSLEN